MIHDDDHDENGEVDRNQKPEESAKASEGDSWAHDKWRADPWMRDPWIERGLSEEEQQALDAEAAEETKEKWEPTPEMPREERDKKVAADMNRLVWISLVVAAALLLVVGAGALAGLAFCKTLLPGLAIGCAVAIANLRLMGGGAVALFHKNALGALLGFGASFALLLGGAVFILKMNAAWMLGYGLGIALPALSGIVFGVLAAQKSAR